MTCWFLLLYNGSVCMFSTFIIRIQMLCLSLVGNCSWFRKNVAYLLSHWKELHYPQSYCHRATPLIGGAQAELWLVVRFKLLIFELLSKTTFEDVSPLIHEDSSLSVHVGPCSIWIRGITMHCWIRSSCTPRNLNAHGVICNLCFVDP